MSFEFNHRSRRHIRSKMLLPLFLGAVTFSSSPVLLPRALAQPVAPALEPGAAPAFAPLEDATRAEIVQSLSLVELMQLIGTPLKLEVKDANMEELAAQVRAALPKPLAIEVRQVEPSRFTLDIKQLSAGQILNQAARLSGARVYVLDDHLLITGEKRLTDDERARAKDWSGSVEAGDGSIYTDAPTRFAAIVLKTISDSFLAWGQAHPDIDGKPITKVSLRLAQLSPELRQLVQNYQYQAVSLAGGVPQPPLSPDTTITFDGSKPDANSLEISSPSQQQNSSTLFVSR